MAEISREVVFAKLDATAFAALESAFAFCRLRGNPRVELVHWFHQILQLPDTDLHKIIEHFKLDVSKLSTDFIKALDKLPRGSTSFTGVSPHLEQLMKEAWIYATLLFNTTAVRSGHLLIGALLTADLKPLLLTMSRQWEQVKPDSLTDEFANATQGSTETGQTARDGGGLAAAPTEGDASSADPSAVPGIGQGQSALAKFSDDLTEKARSGKLDPVLGRDAEIRQIIDILMRRRQNNPILTGEAGVGKTAVVEGFALRIAAGEVPPVLKDISVRTLDLGLLQAGASMKGEFEQRLRNVIEEVQASAKPVVLFIDEAHTLIGAGGAAGQGDAANLLKPALARGSLRTIAATTWAEYKKYFEKDPALTRRFQVVKVEEPDEHNAILMLRGIANAQEKHHKVRVLDEAIESAVRLSNRYIPSRQLPDKAVSLLDTACARVGVSRFATPAPVEDSRRRLAAMETELEILDREKAVGINHTDRRIELEKTQAVEKTRLVELESRWGEEQKLIEQLIVLEAKLVAPEPPAEPKETAEKKTPAKKKVAPQGDLEKLQALRIQLADLQGDHPLMMHTVDGRAVSAVVAEWTGIPVGRMVVNQISAVLTLADTMEKRVMGQRHALDTIARRIQTSRAGLDNPDRPVGVFMLAGPSGVGKTETALTLAESLYGGEQNVITINMSEFQEAHTVSTLKGSPPGYVGYGEGGILTEAVRRRPYSVVLLDEVEKAHSDVHELFFQVFDKGRMEDGEGRLIDFKNTIILLTSNVGTDEIMRACREGKDRPDPELLSKALRPPLLNVFPPALLGRLVVVPYYPISDAMLDQIIRLQLAKVERRLMTNHKIPFKYDEAVARLIAARCTETGSGARAVDAIITHTILPEISRKILTALMNGKQIKLVQISVIDHVFTYEIN